MDTYKMNIYELAGFAAKEIPGHFSVFWTLGYPIKILLSSENQR